MPISERTRWTRLSAALYFIVGAALLLRVWGIWFGLPHIFHNDEDLEVVRALQLGSGSFDLSRIYKGGYYFLLFLEYGVLFVVLFIFGVVDSAQDFAVFYFRDPTAFFLIGRATTALIGAINVYLVYLIGRAAYSERTGLFAAAILAVNVLHAKLSHFITVDVPMACLATAAIYFAVRIAQEGSRSVYLWGGVIAALATATKITAVLLVIPILAAHLLHIRSIGGGIRQFVALGRAWGALALFILVYLITTPGFVIHFGGFARFMLGKFGIGSDDQVSAAADSASETMIASINLFEFYFDVLRDSFTWPLLLVALVGIGFAMYRRKRGDIILVSGILAFYVILSMTSDSKEFFPRYMLPVIPMMAVLGGRFLDWSTAQLPDVWRAKGALVLVAILLVLPTSHISAANYWMTQTDTRAIAEQWFAENVPAMSRVFLEGTRTRPSESTIPLQNSRHNVQAMIDHYRKEEPGKARYFSLALRAAGEPTYDLVLVRAWDLRDLSFYKELGVEYFVVRPDVYEGSRKKYHWPSLVQGLRDDPEISLIKTFRPEPDSAPGPYIEVYKYDENTAR